MSWDAFGRAERTLGLWRRGTLAWVMWMTWEVTQRGFTYVESLGKDAAAIMAAATVLAAVTLPVTTLAGYVCRAYFVDKRPAPPA